MFLRLHISNPLFRLTIALVLMTVAHAWAIAAPPPAAAIPFLKEHCFDCHQGSDADGGLDLTSLSAEPIGGLDSFPSERKWVRLMERVRDGEMPPADVDRPPASQVDEFVESIGNWVGNEQRQRDRTIGRVPARRLTRKQVERTLHDLLGIDIPLAGRLPEELRGTGFTAQVAGQTISHFQLQRHLAVVDLALDEAFRRARTGEDYFKRDFGAQQVARRNPRRRCREPEMHKGMAVVWNGGVIFYGRLPATTAPEDGWYRFAITVSALNPPPSGGVWSTVRTGFCISSAPLLNLAAIFEAKEAPQTIEFETWLPKGHMVEVRPADKTLKRARFAGGQIGTGEGAPQNVPGVGIHRVTMQRIHAPAGAGDKKSSRGTDHAVRRLLFGDLDFVAARGGAVRPSTSQPRRDLADLMLRFARRAFRRPVEPNEIQPYVDRAVESFDRSRQFAPALQLGYRALLCSPRFMYLTETPGELDAHAVANRLSYFLTGSTPDERLRELADSGELNNPEVIRAEATRLLQGDAGRRFIEDFAAEWLDLDQIDFTVPDRKLFPKFDEVVQESMVDETHLFLEAMLRDNLPIANLVDADFTFLNSRLARFYEIAGVRGDQMHRVELKPESRRGGLMTQGAILKVTANGSNTSPVVRGVWVSERLLGVAVPPPPDNVPAIEPDIRGATTIREQLEKHRSQDSCASCHVKIDPPGFALENFDPAGQWRERYIQLQGRRRRTGAKIDPSYQFPDGREFADVTEFRQLIASHPERLAHNLAEKLLTYGTGGRVSFADQRAIEAIVKQAEADDYGFRSVLLATVTSPVFLSK